MKLHFLSALAMLSLASPLPAQGPTSFSDPVEPPPPAGFSVVVTGAGEDPGGAVSAWKPARTEPQGPPVERIPEPSPFLLLLGAAAWILLRRKL